MADDPVERATAPEHPAPLGAESAASENHLDASRDPMASSSVYSSESYPYEPLSEEASAVPSPTASPVPLAVSVPPPKSPPPPPSPPAEEDEDEDPEEKGMLRMSFMGHLEELRSRLLRAIGGVLVAFVLSVGFCKDLWNVVSAPAVTALKHLGINPPNLAAITPMENFNVIYLKLPLLVSVFVGSPWVLYQVWAFISPGLYKREKRWAVPFVLTTAGLFITGGCFAYFVAFRFGLEFLLGIGRDIHVTPVVSINEYFDLFVNVTLGIAVVFEMPVLIFFLTLLRLASPRFLLRHSRYAILAITVIAAVLTPTPDAFNMTIFAVPMVLLFFVGIFASFLLIWNREGKKAPWGKIIGVLIGVLVLSAGAAALLIHLYHYQVIPRWPFLLRPRQ